MLISLAPLCAAFDTRLLADISIENSTMEKMSTRNKGMIITSSIERIAPLRLDILPVMIFMCTLTGNAC